jgi:hypothetical protein
LNNILLWVAAAIMGSSLSRPPRIASEISPAPDGKNSSCKAGFLDYCPRVIRNQPTKTTTKIQTMKQIIAIIAAAAFIASTGTAISGDACCGKDKAKSEHKCGDACKDKCQGQKKDK